MYTEAVTVECMKGHPGILEEGKLYSVLGETKEGNYLLFEVPVPEGYTSFSKDRFLIVDTITSMSTSMSELVM